MFSTVRLIFSLINGNPPESKRLFIYYHLDVFKESEPKTDVQSFYFNSLF